MHDMQKLRNLATGQGLEFAGGPQQMIHHTERRKMGGFPMCWVCVYEQGWLRVLARQAFSRLRKALVSSNWPDHAQNLSVPQHGGSNIWYQPSTEGRT